MQTPIEVILPGGTLTANVKCGEWPEVGNARIITTPGHLDIDFEWSQNGAIWQVLPPGASWKCEAIFELAGVGEVPATPSNPSVSVPHVAASTNTYSTSLHIGVIGSTPAPGSARPYFEYLEAGKIYKVYVKLTLIVNGVVLACGFGECDSIHVMEV